VKVLSLNCGSSSLRWGLFETSDGLELVGGSVEEVHDPAEAWGRAQADLEPLSPQAVGHRVVHGGENFTAAARIDADVLREIEAVSPLAPVHNPRCLLGIREAMRIFSDVPHVAVFDTAFHQSMPPAAYHYALPYSFYEKDRIRRYGFHGSSHHYAAECAARLLGKSSDEFTGVTVHLGGGCSIAAIEAGRSVDTSMGMTPLEGLMMGTRSGDLDPAIVLDLAGRPELGPERVERILNEESGLLGVSGVSSDLRQVEKAATRGNERAKLALDMFAHRVRRGIGSALGVLGGSEAVVFTGGIGEHGALMRERILGRLGGIGLELDPHANMECVGREGTISAADSPVSIFVVPAREEWLIARETAAALQGTS
jgi:acetate kinase